MPVIVGVVVGAVVASVLSLVFAVWMFAAARNFARRELKARPSRPLRRVWPDANAAVGSLGDLADVLDQYAADGIRVQCWEREAPGLPPGLIRVVFEQGKQS